MNWKHDRKRSCRNLAVAPDRRISAIFSGDGDEGKNALFARGGDDAAA